LGKDLPLVCNYRYEWILFVQAVELIHLGTLFRASQFLSEELPIRLAHRVQELSNLPDGLNEMPSIQKVQDWYAQSFEVSWCTRLIIRLLEWILTCDIRKLQLFQNQTYRKMSGID